MQNKIKKLLKKYDIEVGETFEIDDFKDTGLWHNCYFSEAGYLHIPFAGDFISPVETILFEGAITNDLLHGRAKIIKAKTILDAVEKKYLKAVCKPYDIENIQKLKSPYATRFYIRINLKNGDSFPLPYFSLNSKMYRGMDVYKPYTLDSLGIKYGC